MTAGLSCGPICRAAVKRGDRGSRLFLFDDLQVLHEHARALWPGFLRSPGDLEERLPVALEIAVIGGPRFAFGIRRNKGVTPSAWTCHSQAGLCLNSYQSP
jgi:hypothetical protein